MQRPLELVEDDGLALDVEVLVDVADAVDDGDVEVDELALADDELVGAGVCTTWLAAVTEIDWIVAAADTLPVLSESVQNRPTTPPVFVAAASGTVTVLAELPPPTPGTPMLAAGTSTVAEAAANWTEPSLRLHVTCASELPLLVSRTDAVMAAGAWASEKPTTRVSVATTFTPPSTTVP